MNTQNIGKKTVLSQRTLRLLKITAALAAILVIITLAIPNLSGFGQIIEGDFNLVDESQSASIDVNESPRPLIDQIIIKYHESGLQNRADAASAHQMSQLSQAAGVTLTYFREMSGDAHVLRLSNRMEKEEVARISALLSDLPEVAYAEPDYIMFPATIPNDPGYQYQWHYFNPATGFYGINMPPVWDTLDNLPSVVVAVLDTGILFNHEDLIGQTVPGYDFVSNVHQANDGDGRDPDASDPGDWVTWEETLGIFAGCPVRDSTWHGTHVGGTIAAASNNNTGVAGVNWTAKILPVRVLGKCGGSSSDIADGMLWSAGLSVPGVPDNPNPAKILNLSLGGQDTCPTTYQNAIDAINATGASIIVAAGNNDTDASLFTPANCNGVITVGATGMAGDKASYSNFGQRIDLSAPGGDFAKDGFPGGVLSTSNEGTKWPEAHAYKYENGTSMAAPHVAGVVSIMYALNPSLTWTEVLQNLQSTVTPFPMNSTCNTSICGSGIMNAHNAIQQIELPDPTDPPDPPDPTTFTKVAPAFGATDQSLTPALSWTSSPDAQEYQYCVDTINNDACDGEWVVVNNDLTVTLDTLHPNTTYYWQVRSVSPSGTTYANDDTWWSFTTEKIKIFMPIITQ